MKIRVLEVLASLKRAGAEQMAVSLAVRLDPSRFEVGLVSLFDALPDGLEPALAEAGVQTWHLGKHPGLDLRMVPRLYHVMRDFRPAVPCRTINTVCVSAGYFMKRRRTFRSWA